MYWKEEKKKKETHRLVQISLLLCKKDTEFITVLTIKHACFYKNLFLLQKNT